jgi:predicted  nucleic acid-binding Zn-ribbon protein
VSVIEKLLAVQERDVRIRRIKQELTDIPARQEAEQTRLAEHKAALEAAEEALKLKQSDVKQLEIESDSKKEQISKLRQQQMELKSNKEFKAMELEIKTVETAISSVEDRELVLMEEVEAAREDVKARKADLEEEQSAVDEDVKMLGERAIELKAELAEEEKAREEAAKDVEPDWLARYNQVISRRETALVPVEHGVCGGCHMKLPPSASHDAKKRMHMVTCDFCGRLLYA